MLMIQDGQGGTAVITIPVANVGEFLRAAFAAYELAANPDQPPSRSPVLSKPLPVRDLKVLLPGTGTVPANAAGLEIVVGDVTLQFLGPLTLWRVGLATIEMAALRNDQKQ